MFIYTYLYNTCFEITNKLFKSISCLKVYLDEKNHKRTYNFKINCWKRTVVTLHF